MAIITFALNKLRLIGNTAIRAWAEYRKHQPLVLASSTSFFTLFALPPMMVIFITIISGFTKPDSVSNRFFTSLTNYMGELGANQIRVIFDNFRTLGDRWWISVFGFFFLIFVATTLISLVQKFLNKLWEIQKKPVNSAFVDRLLDRILFFMFLVVGGVLFLIGFSIDTFISFLGNRFYDFFPYSNQVLVKTINMIFSLITETFWFTMLFKIIPNAQIHWRPAIVGGIFTAVLFFIGKLVLNAILIDSNIGIIFGPADSIVLVLLFIFYTALIFYYGAMFTKVYAEAVQLPIRSGSHSVKVKLFELEEEENVELE